MKKCIGLLWAMLLSLYAQGQTGLHFDSLGQFKIMQVTDLHLNLSAPEHRHSCSLLSDLLDAEQPDLLMFTGDIVYGDSALAAWARILQPVIARRIPWAAVFGNHDSEQGPSRAQQWAFLRAQPYCQMPPDPEQVAGIGNYALPLMGYGTQQPRALLYGMDTHADAPDRIGGYAWADASQIAWYRAQQPESALPALAFVHIPLPEYTEAGALPQRYGQQGEGVACPKLNSGLFAAMAQKGDVMGLFAGHDHDNNFLGQLHGICLAYGQCGGYQAYGSLPRGARLIRLYEGRRQFDTWVHTPKGTSLPYTYPSGLPHTLDQVKYLPAAAPPKKLLPGLRYQYREGNFRTLDDMLAAEVKTAGSCDAISLEKAERADHFGLSFEGYVRLPQRDIYRFWLNCDDGARLYIDDVLVAEHARSQRGLYYLPLEAGMHRIQVAYYEDYMGERLILQMGAGAQPLEPLQDLWHDPKAL